jgi:hypothetical protein
MLWDWMKYVVVTFWFIFSFVVMTQPVFVEVENRLIYNVSLATWIGWNVLSDWLSMHPRFVTIGLLKPHLLLSEGQSKVLIAN